MRAILAAALSLLASPALAHGVEGLVMSLAVAGAIVGVIGGVASAAFRWKILVGLGISAAVLVIGELALLLGSMEGSPDPLGEVGGTLMLLAIFAAIPLAIAFFAAFAVFSMVRNLRQRTP